MKITLLITALTLGPLAQAQNTMSEGRTDTKTAQKSARPRQILLDARIFIVDPCGLRELGNWEQMTLRADEAFLPSRDSQCSRTSRMLSFQMHRAPDLASTKSLLATLCDLENGKRLQFVNNPQCIAQDGREIRLNFLREEWVFFSGDSKRDSARQAKLVKAMVWPKIWITPHLNSHNELVLDTRFGFPEGPAGKRKDTPVTPVPRTEKISVTVCNDGTVAWAGLAPAPEKKARASGLGRIPLIGAFFRGAELPRQADVVIVFLTASLIPE
jgi:hypothetical protein